MSFKEGETYIFIDVGNFSRYYQQSVSKWLGEAATINFTRIKKSFQATRMFFYDCVDENAGEDASELIRAFRSVSGSHVRLGTLVGSEKNRRQKEVDILLAVDMLNHAVRGNMRRAVLMSGDRDFKPVIESLVQMGVWVEVAGDKFHTSKELAQAGDRYHELTLGRYLEWTLADESKLYTVSINVANESETSPPIIETGMLDSTLYEFRKFDHAAYGYLITSSKGISYCHRSAERLKLYFELEFGKIKWKPI